MEGDVSHLDPVADDGEAVRPDEPGIEAGTAERPCDLTRGHTREIGPRLSRCP